REHGVRLSFENLDFTAADAVTLGARLAELEAKETGNRLQSAEVRLLREARRLRDENKLAPETLVDLGARYTGIIDGDTVAVFLDRLTDDTPYLARKLGAIWLIQPRAASRLNFPVTLKTAGLTVDAAVQAILAQAPAGKAIGTGMVFSMPVSPGTDPTPWLSVLAPALNFKNKPAAEALCLLTESARPASLWELAGYRDSRMLSLTSMPVDDTLAVVNRAQVWLRLIDQGSFIQSWRESASFFQKSTTENDWVNALNTARTPLGETKTRRLKTTEFLSRVPNAPDGRYLVMQFNTAFTTDVDTTETVTFSRESDGEWRAVGYYIQ
ncbi:MAG: DUF4019 domain-containing protein, partial [Opitutaceae bacterium]|nr:DUF4019 domain-containing protein [Opitutaceae bacterium]